jgi:hypothetical protein
LWSEYKDLTQITENALGVSLGGAVVMAVALIVFIVRRRTEGSTRWQYKGRSEKEQMPAGCMTTGGTGLHNDRAGGCHHAQQADQDALDAYHINVISISLSSPSGNVPPTAGSSKRFSGDTYVLGFRFRV